MKPFITCVRVVCLTLVMVGVGRSAIAAPEGTIAWGLHITLAARWLDPAETEGLITPFMIFYAIHDALVKPMPTSQTTPSLAESWTASPDGLNYTFQLFEAWAPGWRSRPSP